MVGLIVRLRWRLWSRVVQRNTGLLVATVLGLTGGAGLGLLAVSGLVVLRSAALEQRSVAVAALTALTIGWLMLSALSGSSDSTVDPARFALLPVRAHLLARGLLAAVLTGIPSVILAGVALASVVTWSQSLGTALAALLGAVLGLLTTVLLARVVVGALAGVMGTRRGRGISAAMISALAFLPAIGGILFGNAVSAGQFVQLDVAGIARTLAWTPPGWAWGIPLHLAHGDLAGALAATLLAGALVVVLWRAYVHLVERTLTRPLTSVGGQRIRGRGLIVRAASLGPVGVIAARRLVMWRRDSRLVTVAVQSFVLPVILVGQAVLTDQTWSAAMALIMLAVLSGLSLLNDLAYDGTAWAAHVLSGVAGWQDRLGRVLATAVLYVPLLVILYAVVAGLGYLGDEVRWAAYVLVALGAALGSSSLIGAVMPGHAPRPGGNPFASTSGSGTEGFLGGLLAVAVPLLLMLPLVLAGGLLPDGLWLSGVLVVVALAWGGALVAAGVALGGRRLDRRAPEMLDRLRRAEL